MGVFFTRNSSLVNSRLGILEFPIEILGSSWGMTQKAKPEDNREFKIPRDCFASPLNDENSRIHKDEFRIPERLLRFARNDEF